LKLRLSKNLELSEPMKNYALRHQIGVLQRSARKRPKFAPPGIFLRHPHHQPLGFLVNFGTTPEFAKLRSVELVGDELSVPGQQRIRPRHSRQFSQGFPSEPVAISANVAFAASDNSNLPLIWALKIRFSAARYSFLSKSSWSTVPVM
jgi:hypothetical protein